MTYLGGPISYFFETRPKSRFIVNQIFKNKLQTPLMKKVDFSSAVRISDKEQDLFFRFSDFTFFIWKTSKIVKLYVNRKWQWTLMVNREAIDPSRNKLNLSESVKFIHAKSEGVLKSKAWKSL